MLGIITLGVVFAIGAGRIMLRLTTDYPWLEPGIEIVSGVYCSPGFGFYLWWRWRQWRCRTGRCQTVCGGG